MVICPKRVAYYLKQQLRHMENSKRRKIIGILILILLAGLILVYRQYSPDDYGWFPRCPSKSLLGLECAGCGSQRALHHLLNGNLKAAFQENLLIIPFMIYMALGYGYGFIRNPGARLQGWQKLLFGKWAMRFIIVLVLAYTIYKNLV